MLKNAVRNEKGCDNARTLLIDPKQRFLTNISVKLLF